MSQVVELFGHPAVTQSATDWKSLVDRQWCPFVNRRCIKVRKSEPEISIGTCSVLYGREKRPIIICPNRLLERHQVFVDCLHLLSLHEPGNELHIIPEIAVPGGSVDYFIASTRDGKVKDFVGIELQTLDTTGTVWPARQKYLKQVGLSVVRDGDVKYRPYGMNWKMTAKTILIQLHHKVETFEGMHKYLVLVMQDFLLEYLQSQFQFSHLGVARAGDAIQLHAYTMATHEGSSYRVRLGTRLSTDSDGIARCLGLQAEAKVETENIMALLATKISKDTFFRLG